jgi:hypothetical protein
LYKTGPVDIGEMTVDQERMPSSVDNSMRFGNTTYAEQGPPIIGGNVPTQRESASFSIPASVVNDMNRKPLLDPSLSRRTPAMQTERLQREADREVAADNYESQGPPTFMQQGRDVDIIGGESSRSAGADEREPTGGQSVGLTDPRAKAAKPATQTTDTATEPTTDADQQSLLSRIGGLIANNPELAASGAQLLGGLISNAAQNRAQRRADRTTDQRVARANLISAITGGRARPTVERAQADTGGFLSLDTLGKVFQGGGAAYKGELARQVEEAERERKAGLDERAAELAEAQAESLDAYRKGTLGQREKEFNAQQDLLKAQAEQALAEQGEVNLTQLRANVKDIDDGLGLRKTGGYLDSSQGPKKLYNDMRVLFRQFEEDPNSANIMGIIQVYQRLFDPATVREGDVALMREAEGRIKQAVALAERVIGDGGVVSSYTIEDMKKAADDVHAMQLAKAKADVGAYTSRLFSATERKVLDEYYDDILSVRELPGEGEGSFISDLAGASLNLD